MLPFFSAVYFEHDFSIIKAELGKYGENLAMIMNYKGKLSTLSHNSERLPIKVLKVSTFVTANMIFATLFLNRDASLVV